MLDNDLEELRTHLDELNLVILHFMNEQAKIVEQIGKIKEKQGVKRYDSLRERHMLDLLNAHNKGPLNQITVDTIFKQIFQTSLNAHEADTKKLPI